MLSLACRHVYNDFKVHISSRHAIDTTSSTCNSNKACDPRPSRIPHRSDRLLTFLRFQSRPGEGRPLRSRSPHKFHLDPDEIQSSRYHRLRKVASDPHLQQSASHSPSIAKHSSSLISPLDALCAECFYYESRGVRLRMVRVG